MINAQFPITGMLRFPLLILEWINMVLSLELGFTFLIKYLTRPMQLRKSQELGFSSFFIGLAFLRFFTIMGDFFSSDFVMPFISVNEISQRLLLENCGIFSILLSMFLFAFFIEKHDKFLFTRFFFTICFLTSLILFLIPSFSISRINQFAFLIYLQLFFILYIFYITNFLKSIYERRETSRHGLRFIFPFFFLLLGITFSIGIMSEIFGLVIRIFAPVLQLISISILFFFFIRLPAFSEFGWQNKIEELIIMEKSGRCIYYESFIDKTIKYKEALITGAISSINIVLEELTSTDYSKTSIIEKKDKIVNIHSGKYITGVIISNEKLSSINYNLEKFIDKVENIYEDILIDWDGVVEVFSPIKNIIYEFFSKTEQ